jgi:RHS repeat-associated protein
MQMQLSFDVRIPDGLLAANALLNEKPHQGVPSWNLALHQGIDERNSTAAIGIRASAQLNRIWPRSTGKERDAESGNDYFGARYYSSAMGRFMSPDWADKPEAVPYSSLDNPQSLNLYGYVNNNPLSKVDKDGHCLEDACVVEGAVAIVAFGALTVSTYLQTPSGQRSLANAASSASAAISSTFHSIFSKSDTPVPEVVVDGNKHPESAQHVAEAQAAGHPAEVTIDRGNAKTNRAEALKGTPAVPGKQRDEYPPASTQEGGGGASVRPINGSDNAGSGASYGNQIRPFADGTKIRITPINVPKPPQ